MYEDARIKMYLASLVLSAFAGLACQFRPDAQPITWRACFGAMLNSGLCGLAITLLLAYHMAAYPEALMGMSIVAGLGGMKTVDIVFAVGSEMVAATLRAAADKFTKPKEKSE